MGAWRGILALVCALAATPGVCDASEPKTATLKVEVRHTFGGEPIRFDDVSLRSPLGNTISVSRLTYLISGASLRRADGTKVEAKDTFGLINAAFGRTWFVLPGVPVGEYAGISFDIGLDPAHNHSDPAKYGPQDPLNPLVNGLHWGWQGGYVFMAIEGRYVLPADRLGGYSFHIATDAHLMHVELPGKIEIRADSVLTIGFDVAKVFAGARPVVIRHEAGGDSTHSGKGDQLAADLAANIPRAFSFGEVSLNSQVRDPETPAAVEPPAGTRRFYLKIPPNYPEPPMPRDNPLTVEGVALGEKLFFERRLSANDAQSCADCHHPKAAFSDPGKALSKGIDGLDGHRNTMPLFNLAWMGSMTWDGKRARVRDQAVAPIQDELEMHQTLGKSVEKLEADADYRAMFERAFATPGITAERLGLALEQYLLTLISSESKFDKAMREEVQFTEEEKRGLLLFVTEFDPARGQLGADCFHCHSNEFFTDFQFKNNGLDSEPVDRGRFNATGRDADIGKFKTPSLRNVELTGPYMHDGRFATLEEVIDHYADGIASSATLDPNIAKHPDGGLALSCEDRKAIVAFLRTLTDEKYREP